MKVLHFSSARTWRGGEQQIAYLLEELKLLDVEQEVLCVADSKMEAFCLSHRFPFSTYNKGPSVSPLPGLKLASILKNKTFDIIHLHDAHSHSFACIGITLFGIKAPLVLSRRVDFPIKKSFLSRWKYNHSSIKAIICVSHFIKKVIKNDIKEQAKIKVVHSGIDIGRFRFSKNDKLRSEYNIPSQTPLIANVAAIAPHKDLFTFVDTAALILQSRPEVKFMIIGGDGGKELEIRTYIQQKNLQNNIILTGFRRDIPEILPGIDIFLFTSETEGLGTSLLDALACRVPIVATAAGGIPEIVEHEKTGLLAPVKDAAQLARQVLRLLKDQALRDQLIENGSKKLEFFSKTQTAKETLKIYQSILDMRS